MPCQFQFVCPLPNGFHARPASALEEVACGFVSEITLAGERSGRAANAKSVLAIVGGDIRGNEACTLAISGPDEEAALAALTTFVTETLPHCDDVLPAVSNRGGETPLPVMLRDASVASRRGTTAVPGIALGRIVQIGGFKIPPELPLNGVTDPAAERRRLDEALRKLIPFYDRRVAAAGKKIEVELLKAHRSIARDQEFQRHLCEAIATRRRTVAGAIADAGDHFANLLAASRSAVLRERALDLQDVCAELLRQAYGRAAGARETQLTTDAIVVAESLTPGQFLALERKYFKGLALGQAGATSHTVILARSFGIPTLTAIPELAGARLENQEAILDADGGALLTNLTDSARRYYLMERSRLAERENRIQRFRSGRAVTSDQHPLEIGANIATPDEAAPAFAGGADGIGLFRTEMLFVDRASAPGEAEQFEACCRVLAAAGGRPVIIRTLDAGGDKPLEYLGLPPEDNPFLGCRGVRLYPAFEALFRTQIRALVRASAHGKLKLLLPMITTVQETRWVKKIIAGEQEKCAVENIPFDQDMPIGAMIEVPAAAFVLEALCRELDFFSIGSNDLLQYFVAADRANARVGGLYHPLQPAFLRLLKQIVDTARAHGKWIGLCGEMAAHRKYIPLLAGLGLNEISVASPAIAGLKAEIAGVSFSDCQKLLAEAIQCATVEEVAARLEQFELQRTAPLIDPELVLVDSEAATKQEAIKQAVDRLYVAGRTDCPHAIEEAVWQREATYSTGFGHGFAFPHCKTNATRFNSLVLLKLRAPVHWNSLDGQPVRVLVLLIVRETGGADAHMKIFARLARQMVDENFRARLEAGNDAGALCALVRDALQI